MMHYLIGELGHLFIIIAFISALAGAYSYFQSTRKQDLAWRKNGRTAFYVHGLSVLGIIVILYIILYNNYFEYHYAWSHSSRHLPFYYKISAFWEGQEGSFLLWIFWHVILGLVIIGTGKNWESPVMFIFLLVQAFLASMILGVVVANIKIGSSPFMLTRDVINAPIFKMNAEFIPKDGSGLNPLLQNYWMVIHPPTLFLGFAATIVPFSFGIAALWQKKYTEWIRPVIPWTLFTAAVLGAGIVMGAIWAYETLNFGGYWNWDPVENAIFVPWLVLVAALHSMIIYRKHHTALRLTFILVVGTFLLILYSTFLTRSGILGNASVHSFTDLGLSGQLLIYLLFFTIMSGFFMIKSWKQLPVSRKEITLYAPEFWILIGATILCLSAFQVITPTSIPVFNAILENFGIHSNLAPPADQVLFYSKVQVWFAMSIAVLTGIGQFFWWRNLKKENIFNEFSVPVILTLLISTLIIALSGFREISFLILITATVFAIVSNINTLVRLSKRKFVLSGGSIAHIGVAFMLIGILYSSGLSKVISLNRSGMLYSSNFPDEVNKENILLFQDQPREMEDYQLIYTGKKIKLKSYNGYFNKKDFEKTPDLYRVVARKDIFDGNILLIRQGDTLQYNPENTYYEVRYQKPDGQVFNLYPRLQENPNMGNVVSPSIKKAAFRDIYTHVTVVANEEKDWSEAKNQEVPLGGTFFANDYVCTLDKFERTDQIEGVKLQDNDIAVKGIIKIQGATKDYTLEPIYLIRNNYAGRIPDENEALGIKISVMKINPDKNSADLGISTTQKDYIILKAIEKPLINILWLGTIILIFGFTVAAIRRIKNHSLKIS